MEGFLQVESANCLQGIGELQMIMQVKADNAGTAEVIGKCPFEGVMQVIQMVVCSNYWSGLKKHKIIFSPLVPGYSDK